MFHHAGHVIGSSIVSVMINDVKIVYTGDLGTTSLCLPSPCVCDDLRYPNVLISEATYGGVRRLSFSEICSKIASYLREQLDENKKVLIPISSVGKLQEMLRLIKVNESKLCCDYVVVEGLGAKTVKVYESMIDYLDAGVQDQAIADPAGLFGEYVVPKTLKDRWRIINHKGPAVILAPSGDLSGGMSTWWLDKLAHRLDSSIVILGYVDEDSPASMLLKRRLACIKDPISGEEKIVRVHGELRHFPEFSRHASHDQIVQYVSKVKPETLILVHGTRRACEEVVRSCRRHFSQAIIAHDGLTVVVK